MPFNISSKSALLGYAYFILQSAYYISRPSRLLYTLFMSSIIYYNATMACPRSRHLVMDCMR
ncbi:uncharacterized protein BO87DRAFT_19618 [Aspergillus neoniger CBS 115656]|uniref:Uncharacterized protein n=1 Tax=Aspergillus neoniger (strain CBS 115656) TaxID=1448310 RepID=A0A318YWF3_ASPNB|nr:hypothetical protein BO87DRAFT_19618 [Aspergillus neoniger CBS 115656]PYH36210.1 hypothetical protein BO87DRAFT_19618 [Aspergillus neoniger CBS 115656]